MSKVKIKFKMNEYKTIINGIIIDNKIRFLLDKKIVTITINDNNIIMKRKYNDLEFTYICFDKQNPEAYYFCNNKYPLNIKIMQMKNDNNIIEIKYKIEEDIYEFKLEYEGCEI